jgi:hypothetical protein
MIALPADRRFPLNEKPLFDQSFDRGTPVARWAKRTVTSKDVLTDLPTSHAMAVCGCYTGDLESAGKTGAREERPA